MVGDGGGGSNSGGGDGEGGSASATEDSASSCANPNRCECSPNWKYNFTAREPQHTFGAATAHTDEETQFPFIPSGFVSLTAPSSSSLSHSDSHIHHVSMPSPARNVCSHSRCIGGCLGERYFIQAFNEWIDDLAGPPGAPRLAQRPSRSLREYVPPATPAAQKHHPTPQDMSDEMESAFTAANGGSEMMIDCGANVHFLTIEDARRYFRNQRATRVSILGVSGTRDPCSAEGEITLNVIDENGKHLNMSLGTGYASGNVPHSLISASLLLAKGAILNLERGNSYIEFPGHGGGKFRLKERNGLFWLPIAELEQHASMESIIGLATAQVPDETDFIEHMDAIAKSAQSQVDSNQSAFMKRPDIIYAAHAAFGDVKTWHERMAHMSPATLKKIFEGNLVNGFLLKGKFHLKDCTCSSCQLAKIRAKGSRKGMQKAQRPGSIVSTDIKSIGTTALGGFKYLICFVDHCSRFSMDVPLRTKKPAEVISALCRFISVMNSYGHVVSRIQSDRGSEFFAFQDGELSEDVSQYDKETCLGEFTAACATTGIHHSVTPVESHERLAENHFSWASKNIDVMLYAARLSPVFWADCYQYACYLHNRTPCLTTGVTPWTRISGEPTDWSSIRKFGSSAVMRVANDPLRKHPGIVRGKHAIFVGFDSISNGYRLFDPISRRYFSGVEDIVIYEDFSARRDSLRNFDRRREIEAAKGQQPLIIDDNEISDFDKTSMENVRSLYIDPEEVDPVPYVAPHDQLEAKSSIENDQEQNTTLAELLTATGEKGAKESAQASVEQQRIARLQHLQSVQQQMRRRSTGNNRKNFTVAARKGRVGESLAEAAAAVRPLRLTIVGKEQKLSNDDLKFLVLARDHDFECKYHQRNPKKQGSQSHTLYERFKMATTLQESIDLGGSWSRVKDDYSKGFIQFPGRESRLPGHIFAGLSNGRPHILSKLGIDIRNNDEEHELLAATFTAYGKGKVTELISASMEGRFHEVIKGIYEGHLISNIWDDMSMQAKLIEESGVRLMASDARVNYTNIDYNLEPEPDYKKSLQENGCKEWFEWLQARRDELKAMQDFGVYRVVDRKEAIGKKMLTSKWVHKRKTNKFGEVSRYKARLVARGFAQLPYDSFNPEEIFAHVIDRNSLRTLLSIAAGRNMKVYSADVSNAFLQAPLSEPIYMEPPPGSDIPPDKCLVLDRAIYGCRQSARAWSDELDAHLLSTGFSRTTADPCLWTRKRDGKEWFVATYVDDLTICCNDDAARDTFMKELREKFEVKESEGEPIDYLLGIHIEQNLEAGTIRMSQELATTKLVDTFLSEKEKQDAWKATNPMKHTIILEKLEERQVQDSEFRYLSAIGSFLYLSAYTRPDIAAATSILARHANAPGKAHVSAVKHLLQYLYNTKSYGIEYRRDANKNEQPIIWEQGRHPLGNENNLTDVFVDSDYAADSSRRSTQGYVVMMNGGPISWRSVLGKTICTSTAEAEVMAAVSAAKEAMHLKLLLGELGAPNDTIHIQEDNTAAIAQATGGLRHIRKAKHYSIALRFLQQLTVDGEIKFHHLSTDRQLADIFTKPLDPENSHISEIR